MPKGLRPGTEEFNEKVKQLGRVWKNLSGEDKLDFEVSAQEINIAKDDLLRTPLPVSGGLAGVAGVIEVSANMGRLQPEISFGYGFTAIIVAFLGRLNPIGIIFAGIIIATVKLGADNAQMAIGIPKVVTGLFEGILLFFLLTGETLQKYQIAWKGHKDK